MQYACYNMENNVPLQSEINHRHVQDGEKDINQLKNRRVLFDKSLNIRQTNVRKCPQNSAIKMIKSYKKRLKKQMKRTRNQIFST